VTRRWGTAQQWRPKTAASTRQVSSDAPLHRYDTINIHQRGKMTSMNDFNGSTTTRATLRLKVMPRRTPPAIKTLPLPQTQSKANLKPGARWSDNYKERMQADMDTLASR
jgi:hypothetical protein